MKTLQDWLTNIEDEVQLLAAADWCEEHQKIAIARILRWLANKDDKAVQTWWDHAIIPNWAYFVYGDYLVAITMPGVSQVTVCHPDGRRVSKEISSKFGFELSHSWLPQSRNVRRFRLAHTHSKFTMPGPENNFFITALTQQQAEQLDLAY